MDETRRLPEGGGIEDGSPPEKGSRGTSSQSEQSWQGVGLEMSLLTLGRERAVGVSGNSKEKNTEDKGKSKRQKLGDHLNLRKRGGRETSEGALGKPWRLEENQELSGRDVKGGKNFQKRGWLIIVMRRKTTNICGLLSLCQPPNRVKGQS